MSTTENSRYWKTFKKTEIDYIQSKKKVSTITTNWETTVIPYCNHYWSNSKEEG
jgi:hypothetical protein